LIGQYFTSWAARRFPRHDIAILPRWAPGRPVADDFRERPDAFLIAECQGYCLRRLADRPEALVDYVAPGDASRMRAEFEQIWEQSDVDTELRRLYL
jgi:hypothetical protein